MNSLEELSKALNWWNSSWEKAELLLHTYNQYLWKKYPCSDEYVFNSLLGIYNCYFMKIKLSPPKPQTDYILYFWYVHLVNIFFLVSLDHVSDNLSQNRTVFVTCSLGLLTSFSNIHSILIVWWRTSQITTSFHGSYNLLRIVDKHMDDIS